MDKQRSLNNGQLELLVLITKYRFVTVKQLSETLSIQVSALHEKLDILQKQGYVIKRYDASYKFKGRPAGFCVTPRTLRLLKELGKAKYITDNLIKISYKDKSQASEQFMDDCFTIFDMAKNLERSYPGIKLYTARQLSSFDYFPKPLPDLYVVHGVGQATTRYFLFRFAAGKQYFTHIKQIKQLIAYTEEDNWSQTGNDFPTILTVCDTASIERLVQRTCRQAISQSSEVIDVYTTSTKAVTSPYTDVATIWTDIEEPDELISL
jgi:DNA-binding Lrp family transcriptional regulator